MWLGECFLVWNKFEKEIDKPVPFTDWNIEIYINYDNLGHYCQRNLFWDCEKNPPNIDHYSSS
jgi:hypothetical protein